MIWNCLNIFKRKQREETITMAITNNLNIKKVIYLLLIRNLLLLCWHSILCILYIAQWSLCRPCAVCEFCFNSKTDSSRWIFCAKCFGVNEEAKKKTEKRFLSTRNERWLSGVTFSDGLMMTLFEFFCKFVLFCSSEMRKNRE